MRRRYIEMSARNSIRGGAAIEYVLVTTFAAGVSIAAMGFVGSMLKEKLTALSEITGTSDLDLGRIPFFDEED